jgi:Zn-dependent alcohol dehydrogenase
LYGRLNLDELLPRTIELADINDAIAEFGGSPHAPTVKTFPQ